MSNRAGAGHRLNLGEIHMSEFARLNIKQLVEDKQNGRSDIDEKGIDALAQSIRTQGLIVPLIVRSNGKEDRFSVIDGKRRLLALQKLGKDAPEVPCIIREDLNLKDGEAAVVSLSANVVREAMNPADEVRAFVHLRDAAQKTPQEIAAYFGISHQRVRQRLAIGCVSAKVLDTLRDGKISPDVAAAFTADPDHKKQEQVLALMLKQHWADSPESVRRALRQDKIVSTSTPAKIVGRKAYEAAGGKVFADLFDNVVIFEDAALVHRLLMEKFSKIAESLKEQGWKWVEFKGSDELPDDATYSWPRENPSGKASLDDKSQKRMDLLAHKKELSDEEERELDELRSATMATRYSKAQRAKSGVIIDAANGQLTYGVMKPSDKKAEVRKAKKEKAGGKTPVPVSLASDLSELMLGGVQVTLTEEPQLAEIILIAHLLATLDPRVRATVLDLHGQRFVSGLEENLAHVEFLDTLKKTLGEAPHNFEAAVEWLRKRSPQKRAQMMAVLVAALVSDHESLGKVVKPKMVRWFKPTKHKLLERYPREQLAAFMKELAPKSKEKWAKRPRATLAKEVAKAAEAQGWVPKELRT